MPGEGGGGAPLYKLYRYSICRPKGYVFGLKTGMDFDHYGLKSGMVHGNHESDVRQMQTADLQTQHSGLSQFISKIILYNLRHSTSCAVRLVCFKATWLLSRLS